MDEWDERHAQPLLARAVPSAVREQVREAKQSLNQLSRERPLAGLEALAELGSWVEGAIRRLRGPTRRGLSEGIARDRHLGR